MSDITIKSNLNEFSENCTKKYDMVPKADQTKRHRCFVTNGKIPTQSVEITAVYEANDNPSIKIICAQNGVRRNHYDIWGSASVVSIEKRNFRISSFKQVKSPDEIAVNMLLIQRDYLKHQKQELSNEIYRYSQELNYANFGVFPTRYC